MNQDSILEIIKKSEKSLALKITNPSKFLQNYSIYMDNLNKIKQFDFTKYKNYLAFNSDDLFIPFSRLRDDNECSCSNQTELFKNAVKFKDGMVILKNEK